MALTLSMHKHASHMSYFKILLIDILTLCIWSESKPACQISSDQTSRMSGRHAWARQRLRLIDRRWHQVIHTDETVFGVYYRDRRNIVQSWKRERCAQVSAVKSEWIQMCFSFVTFLRVQGDEIAVLWPYFFHAGPLLSPQWWTLKKEQVPWFQQLRYASSDQTVV